MGYWSTHPLGGDAPMDMTSYINEFIYKQEGGKLENDSDWRTYLDNVFTNEFNVTVTNFLKDTQKLSLLTESVENGTLDDGDSKFVLPFMICEKMIVIEDKNLSNKIKNLIGDGGSSSRGYTKDDEDSPLKFARLLHDNWEKLQEVNYKDPIMDIILDNPGLFDVIAENISSNDRNIVNKK